MAINPQPLLARTRVYRDDLLDSVHLYCMYTAMRKLCKESLAFRVPMVYTTGTGATAATIPLSAIIASAAVNYDPIQVTDAYWLNTQPNPDVWNQLDAMNKTNLYSKYGLPGDASFKSDGWYDGPPEAWANDRTNLIIFPRPDAAYQIRVEMAVMPRYDNFTDAIDLPNQAEDAIVFGALSELFAMPGPKMDLQKATYFENKWACERDMVTGLEMLGNSGVLLFERGVPFVQKKGFASSRYSWPR